MDNFKSWLESTIDEAEYNRICSSSKNEEEYWNGYIKAMTEALDEWKMVMKDGNELSKPSP